MGIPPPKKLTTQTAAKLCALTLFFGRDNQLQIYHGNFLLMDNKHRKLFVIISTQNGANLCLKCTKIRWGSLSAPQDPLAAMGRTSKGREGAYL